LRSILARLEKAGLVQQCARGKFEPYPQEKLTRVHSTGMIERAKHVAEAGGGFLDADTILSPRSFDVALAAVGACTAAVEAVVRGPDQRALCLVRPPGHHATPDRSMGFCLFDNVALAAAHARTELGIERVLIVDWDVHHGNGTQDIFYADPTIHFLSIHRYGHGFYPGTGAADETGTGPGLGQIRNVPVRFGTPRPQYLSMFRTALEESAQRCKPELVILSAGFDAHARDPIGSLGLESEDFTDLTRMVLDVATTHAQGRLVSCLEGGYNLEALAESVEAHLHEL
jgi:acetoin utilization deacetylase AcuC-like enzyme